MSYVWINPVVDSMYDAYVLDEFLRRYGHKRVETTKDWGMVVKEKYWLEVCKGKTPVVDMRCPRIKEVLTEMDVSKDVVMADIEPILIHCGREISEREELDEAEKIITTPCQALADMGNDLALENTWFVPWNKFVKMLGDGEKNSLTGNGLKANVPKENIRAEKSPIPPGFFDDLMLGTVSLTGEDKIRAYFQENMLDDVHLVELLYCKDGCHNGDGVRLSE